MNLHNLANELKALSLAEKLRTAAALLDRKRPDVALAVMRVAQPELDALGVDLARKKQGGT
ncbi:MAG TPA: hypothetical protein PK095_00035 [Myxococcota bacterium]|nr:hypothetical protein [Myxococcota bacterium]